MRQLSIILGLLASVILAVGLTGCGGGNREAAKAPEANPWADYKGTYAAGAAEPTPAPEPKAARAAEAKPEASASAAPPPPRKAATKKRTKAGAKKAPRAKS